MAETGKITLYSYWLSSCSQRVRIALNLKGLGYEYQTVDILKGKIFDPDCKYCHFKHSATPEW